MQAAARPKVMAGLALAGANLIVVTPIAAAPVDHLSTAAVRLTSGSSDLLDLGNLGGLSDLGNVGNLFSGLNLDGLQNIPYNLFADVVDIPYYESLALDEYAYALGPADTAGGVAGWIPTGTSPADIVTSGNDLYYGVGGTGSWYMESLGNTWGWDDGNWPQLDALLHFALPFSFTEDLANEVQTFAQSEFIDGASIGCEFECANPVGYLGEWAHGATPLLSLLEGTTFPSTLQGDISDPTGQLVTWAGQGGANLLEPLQALAGSLTADPSANPIEFPDLGSVFTNGVKFLEDNMNDFNPWSTGSFVYWGAPTDYSIPSAIGGTIQEFTGIPNQFGFPADQPLGAEPATGPTDGPLSLLTGLPQGLEYLFFGTGQPVDETLATGGSGLLGYLDPGTYLAALESLLSGHTPAILGDVIGLGYLGVPNLTLPSLGDLPGAADLTGILPGAADLTSVLPNAADLSGLLGNTFDPSALLNTFDASGLLAGLDPSSLAGDLSGAATSLGGSIAPDLALNLLTSLF